MSTRFFLIRPAGVSLNVFVLSVVGEVLRRSMRLSPAAGLN